MRFLERNAEETREAWQDQRVKINSLGSIKEILNDKELLLEIITYHGDRHLIHQFFEMVNKEIEKGNIIPEDLVNFRNGWLSDCLVNLDVIVKNSGREKYYFEKGDKLNYATVINDPETQISIFTNPKLIAALAETIQDRELIYCEQSLSYLSVEAQLRVIQEIIKAGNVEKGMQLMNELTRKIERARKYEEEDRNYSNRGRS